MITLIAGRRLCTTSAISKPVGNFLVHGNSPPFTHPMADRQIPT